MLDELDFLYRSDMARKLLFYYQPEMSEAEMAKQNSMKSVKRDKNEKPIEGKYKDRKFGGKVAPACADYCSCIYFQVRTSCS